MAANSKIEWTDHTFNPWRGCQHASLADGTPHPACDNCYAEAMSKRNPATLGVWGPGGTRVLASDDQWKQPRKWNREAEKAGVRQRVFCASLADVFEDWTGPMHNSKGVVLSHVEGACEVLDGMDSVRRRLFELIDATPWLDWLLLTKRPENIRRMWCSHRNTDGLPPSNLHRPNVWLGTSVSDQATADELVPRLLACRDLVPTLFLSAEPLLGVIDMRQWFGPQSEGQWLNTVECGHASQRYGLNWVIVGGESGSHARAMHPTWARDLRDQCAADGVPYFLKQWGEWVPKQHHGLKSAGGKEWGTVCANGSFFPQTTPFNGHDDDGFGGEAVMYRVGKQAAGRLLDGREWNELPNVEAAV